MLIFNGDSIDFFIKNEHFKNFPPNQVFFGYLKIQTVL